jgi:transposase
LELFKKRLFNSKPYNFKTVGDILNIPSSLLYSRYRNCLSSFPKEITDGSFHANDIPQKGEESLVVPILKEENMGEDMAVDEKQVDKEMFTILSNRKTGKIALMAETLKVKQLLSLTDKFSDEKRWAVKTVTCDLSPSYHWFIRQAFILLPPLRISFIL